MITGEYTIRLGDVYEAIESDGETKLGIFCLLHENEGGDMSRVNFIMISDGTTLGYGVEVKPRYRDGSWWVPDGIIAVKRKERPSWKLRHLGRITGTIL